MKQLKQTDRGPAHKDARRERSDNGDLMKLDFSPLHLNMLPRISDLIRENPYRTCDYSAGGLFLWRRFYRVEAALEDGIFYSRARNWKRPDGPHENNLPLGGDTRRGLLRLAEHCRETGEPLVFGTMPEEALPLLRETFGEIRPEETRDYFDYLYLLDDLVRLSGRKYSRQRNHIHQFLAGAGDDWSFEETCEGDREELLHFFERYVRETDKEDASAMADNEVVPEVLNHPDWYCMRGGVLRRQGQVVGFSFAERIGDTLYVHVEKADRNVNGAYPMLVNQFCRMWADSGVVYVNREDDTGDPGLRFSKESWRPLRLLAKYRVEIPAL